ncbi:MAG TPA: aminotransferase class V-fold PLP-dependent enzyme [Mycobacteriales bacterium]|jgi:selenocysteine lyase/cysteine desulfurase|nr:aminotransferase class V-fold PLP-dependent enzyme [Mycobacteriales bacterium]
MLDDQRHLFALPDGVTYLNCAYLGPQLRAVTEAGLAAVRLKEVPWDVTPDKFFSGSEDLRATFAGLVGADAEGVAFVPSVSYGVGVAARNLPLDGRSVLMLAEDFPSDVYAWQAAGEVVTVPRPADDDWTAAVLDRIDANVGVVAVPHVHWTDGGLVDLVRVGEAARAAGAALVVDATQSLGAFPLDLDAVRPDFVVAAGYKWLLGPYALGYLWVAPRHRDGVPLEANWINREASDDFARLIDYRAGYQPGARRYDVGERSNFVLVPMAKAALTQLAEWGVDEIAETTAALTAYLAKGAESLGLRTAPEHLRGPHLMGIRFPDGLRPGIADTLAAQRIHVSIRGDSVRVAPHVYNTTADCDRLLNALED